MVLGPVPRKCKETYNPSNIFWFRAIGLNMSRDADKPGEYQMIFPK